MSTAVLWDFLLYGYALSVLIETPVLLAGLSAGHSWSRRLFAGFWLTACTYPIVILVLPVLFHPLWNANGSLWAYMVVAETFAPAAECGLFAAAFHDQATRWPARLRDHAAIVLANLASFGLGLLFE